MCGLNIFNNLGLCGLFFALALFGGCAGYQIGNQSLYPMEIRTVYVPMFQSASFRPYLGERLTEAVMKEIELKTPYKVVSDPNADSILSGRIVQEGKAVLIGSRVGDPREIQVNIQVMVGWTDRQGRLLRESSAVPLPSELINVQGTGNVAPETGQSIETAQQEAIQRVATQIVSLMEKPW
ncbi:MAG: LPS assembly lipoprotein LptE [Thermoguttaceae bacterium]